MKSHRDWRPVIISDSARKEILLWPLEVRKDLGSILTNLQKDEPVGFPDVDSMRTVAAGCSEIRLKGADGIYRAFYIYKDKARDSGFP